MGQQLFDHLPRLGGLRLCSGQAQPFLTVAQAVIGAPFLLTAGLTGRAVAWCLGGMGNDLNLRPETFWHITSPFDFL